MLAKLGKIIFLLILSHRITSAISLFWSKASQVGLWHQRAGANWFKMVFVSQGLIESCKAFEPFILVINIYWLNHNISFIFYWLKENPKILRSFTSFRYGVFFLKRKLYTRELRYRENNYPIISRILMMENYRECYASTELRFKLGTHYRII